jgi:hypothetical protein
MDSVGSIPTEIMDNLLKKGWVNLMEPRNMYTLTVKKQVPIRNSLKP